MIVQCPNLQGTCAEKLATSSDLDNHSAAQKIGPKFVDKIWGCIAMVGGKSDLCHPQTHEH